MPEISMQQRAMGAHVAETDLWDDHDWTVPTDAATLRHRRFPTPDQSRYGTATATPGATLDA